ncbi:uncharacterized protein LOC116003912 [Ipomoea triloba]|uniref:uncharacterized protein LOC116003912 n=1 Tax=Ipomoea triloba TaxID=35885 RepID=UPI00125E81B4|nr:uncharacterized protein LOC116003912 [Ipomoea triloba]
MNHPYPIDLRVPGNKGYSGKIDPEEHVNAYYGNMLMMGVSDAVICRAFYSTLEGRAIEWFKTLEAKSIDIFAELARRFIQRFATSKAVRRHFTYIEIAKEEEGETLAEFLVKWKSAVGEVEPMDDRTAINVLHSSLRAGPLYQDFILRPPLSYEEALRRVAAHANAAKRRQEAGLSRNDRRNNDRPPKPKDGPSREKAPTFSQLTRLVAEVLDYAQSCNLIRLPEPGRDGEDKSKYCAYHRNRGHNTEDCSSLKRVVEELLRSGELSQFVQKEKSKRSWKKMFRRSGKDRKNRNNQDDKDEREEPPPSSSAKQTIHVFFGGLEGGDDPEECRQWSRELHVGLVEFEPRAKRPRADPIAFTEDDLPS